jgi:hypothetical protein
MKSGKFSRNACVERLSTVFFAIEKYRVKDIYQIVKNAYLSRRDEQMRTRYLAYPSILPTISDSHNQFLSLPTSFR